jgi:hypothetical protein
MTDTTQISFLQPLIPSTCPVCGAVSLSPDASISTLLAVCDVLVFKALEKAGGFIRRESGISRVQNRDYLIRRDSIPMHLVHTYWAAGDDIVSKALENAWDVVPFVLDTHGGCCDYDSAQVIALLDKYVHDLVITSTPHDIDELAGRMRRQLGLPVYRTTEERHYHE